MFTRRVVRPLHRLQISTPYAHSFILVETLEAFSREISFPGPSRIRTHNQGRHWRQPSAATLLPYFGEGGVELWIAMVGKLERLAKKSRVPPQPIPYR